MDRNEDLLDRRLQDVYRVEPSESLHARLLAIADEAPAAATSESRHSSSRRPLRAAQSLGWLEVLRPANFQWRLAIPACAVTLAVAVLWVAGLQTSPQSDPVTASALTEQQQREAMHDFVTVMRYLNASTALAHSRVHNELGSGLKTAFERGEQSFRDSSNRVTNGG